MRKLGFLIILLLFSVPVLAANRYATFTSDGSILDAKRVLCGVVADTGGTNDLVIISYDNTAASGNKPHPPIRIAGSDNYGGMMFGNGVQLRNGYYADITTSGGATVTIIFGITSCD